MSGKKILIVDDEWEIGDILRLHLGLEGYVPQSVQSVDEALKAIEKGPVDLVLLDIQMAGKDGFDFLRVVSTSHGTPKVPVIVMTGCSELEGVMKGIAVDGFVSKPFEISLVLKEVRRVLSEKRKTVYVVDAEGSEKARAIAKELRDERYQVFFIKDMNSFKESWAKQPADYMVMEYEQHSMAGEEMIREIRSCTASPLIVYSYSGMDFREKSLQAGASAYIGKPEDPAGIVTAICQLEMK